MTYQCPWALVWRCTECLVWFMVYSVPYSYGYTLYGVSAPYELFYCSLPTRMYVIDLLSLIILKRRVWIHYDSLVATGHLLYTIGRWSVQKLSDCWYYLWAVHRWSTIGLSTLSITMTIANVLYLQTPTLPCSTYVYLSVHTVLESSMWWFDVILACLSGFAQGTGSSRSGSSAVEKWPFIPPGKLCYCFV